MPSDPTRFIGFLAPSDPRWEEALSRTPHDLFHLPGYLCASAEHTGGTPVLFLLDRGAYGMFIPLIRRGMKGFGESFADYSDLASPYGYPCPLYWGEAWRENLTSLHAQFEAFLREEKIVSLFLRLNPFLGAADQDLTVLGGISLEGPMVYMDLRDEEASWKGINRQNRSFITHMLEQGHEVRIDAWETMDQVIMGYYETMNRLNASPFYYFSRTFFETLRKTTAPHFHLATSFTPQGEISAGCFFSEVGGLIQYFLMGTMEAHLASSPSKLLINALRVWGTRGGHHTLNLGGGVGANRDNLFEFKIRLSKQVATFTTVRKIILEDTYLALAASRGFDQLPADASFFPIYRKFVKDEDSKASQPFPSCLPGAAARPAPRQNIMITSAGRRNSLLLAFREAGQAEGLKVFATEVDPLAPTCFIADGAFQVPRLSDPAYLASLIDLAVGLDVGLIVPTIDTELPILAAETENFRAAGIHVLVSTPEFIRICADKWNTFLVFGKKEVTVPHSWLPENRPDRLPESLFVKPRDGSSSINAYPCSRDELPRILSLVPNPIIQECLQGQEITMDAFLDFQGTPIHYVPRERIRTLGGESIQGVTVEYPGLNAWIENLLRICGELGARGPITMQAFLTEAGPVLTEVNPRFGGGFPLARAAGGEYPLWTLTLLRGGSVEPRLGQYRRGLYMTRHYTETFMEALPWGR